MKTNLSNKLTTNPPKKINKTTLPSTLIHKIYQSDNQKAIVKGQTKEFKAEPTVKHFCFKIEKSSQIQQKLDNFSKSLVDLKQKVYLSLVIQVSESKELIDFTTSWAKVSNSIRYLELELSGKVKDKNSICIGEFIGNMENLYSLNLIINSSLFGDNGILSLQEGLSKLKNLHVLKFTNKRIPAINSDVLTDKGVDSFLSSISTFPLLEIFDISIISKRRYKTPRELIVEGYPHLSHLFTVISLNQNIDILEKCFERRQSKLTSLSLYSYKQNELKRKEEQEQLIKVANLCLTLPYLSDLHLSNYQADDQGNYTVCQILQKYVQMNVTAIQLIYLFNLYVNNALSFNPQLVICDLFII